MDDKSIKYLGVLELFLVLGIFRIPKVHVVLLILCVQGYNLASCSCMLFLVPVSLSWWILLFHLGGEHTYQKLSQRLEEVFNRLTTQHPEYQSCGSSLAAFIIEKGKSGLIVSFGEWETCSHRVLRAWEQLGGQPAQVNPPPSLVLGGQREVVALGTGECNYSRRLESCGRLLHDSHAIVTARRSLLRWECLCTSSPCHYFVSVSLLHLNAIVM